MKFSFVLEDINNLLNTGDIPSLFPNDEKAQLIESLRVVAEKENK
jgi:dynein heavy chain